MERKEITGRHHTLLHPPVDKKKYDEYFKKSLEGNHIKDLSGEVIRKDSAIIPVNIVTSRLILGSSQFVLGIFRHIHR